MEAKKLNQKSLIDVCFILDKYDLTPLRLCSSEKHCHILLAEEHPYIPIYAMMEIHELGFEHFGVCRMGEYFALIFEKEEGSVLVLSEFFDFLPK